MGSSSLGVGDRVAMMAWRVFEGKDMIPFGADRPSRHKSVDDIAAVTGIRSHIATSRSKRHRKRRRLGRPNLLRFPPGGVMVSFVAPLLAWVSLAACFVIGLAAVIQMAGPVAGIEPATGVIRLPGGVTATIVGLFALAAVVFVAHMLRLAWSRRHAEDVEPEGALEPLRVPAWVRAVRQFLAFLYFVALAYVLSRSGISLDRIMARASGGGAGGGPLP